MDVNTIAQLFIICMTSFSIASILFVFINPNLFKFSRVDLPPSEYTPIEKHSTDPNIPPPFPRAPLLVLQQGLFGNGTYCHICDSSLYKKWMFSKGKKCIQPECENYYGYNPLDNKPERLDVPAFLKVLDRWERASRHTNFMVN